MGARLGVAQRAMSVFEPGGYGLACTPGLPMWCWTCTRTGMPQYYAEKIAGLRGAGNLRVDPPSYCSGSPTSGLQSTDWPTITRRRPTRPAEGQGCCAACHCTYVSIVLFKLGASTSRELWYLTELQNTCGQPGARACMLDRAPLWATLRLPGAVRARADAG